MTRSKRKATQARLPAADFTKKKQKLGCKKRATNFTNTGFKSRQVHVPSQTRSETTKPGLSFEDLIARATHYNAQTRLAALNGLCRALGEVFTAAHVEATVKVSGVLAIGLDGIADEHGGVRKAAGGLVVGCVGVLGQVGGFGRAIGAGLMAALSNIRMDVRVSGARLVKRIMECEGVSVESVFGEGGNPLISLGEMMSEVEKWGGKVAILEAIAGLCEEGKEEGDRSRGKIRKRFYYQKERKTGVSGSGRLLLKRLKRDEAAGLLVKCGYIACECLPTETAKRSRESSELLASAVKAMRAVCCEWCLTSEGLGVVKRVIREWGGRGVVEADVGIAGVGVKAGVGEDVLRRVIGVEGVDEIVVEYLQGGGEVEVGRMWVRGFLEKGRRGDWGYVGKVVGVLRIVLGVLEKGEREQLLLKLVGFGWGCIKSGNGVEVMRVVVEWLRKGVEKRVRVEMGMNIAKGFKEYEMNEEVCEMVGAGLFYSDVMLEEEVEMVEKMIVRNEGGIEKGLRAGVELGLLEGKEMVKGLAGLRVLEQMRLQRCCTKVDRRKNSD